MWTYAKLKSGGGQVSFENDLPVLKSWMFAFIRSCWFLIMSTTTTTQTISLLADYEVHHSGSDAVNERETLPQPVEWPTHHRRIPAFRPTNRNLSFEERPGGSNPGEMVFIQVMLHGVWLNAVCTIPYCRDFQV